MTEFIFVRHGEADYSRVEDLHGNAMKFDFAPLTQKGEMEVAKLSDSDIFLNSDLMLVSPYTRTMQTAAIINRKLELPVVIEPLLHEWIPDLNYGLFTSMEIARNARIANAEHEAGTEYTPGIERIVDVRSRVVSVLTRYLECNKVVVISHGMVIRSLHYEEIKVDTATAINLSFNRTRLRQYK